MVCMGLRGTAKDGEDGTHCSKCIHYNVCTEYRVAYWGYETNIDSPIINATPDNCPFFKLEEIYESR